MKLTVGKGMDQYLSQLQNLEFDAPEAVGEAVYEGAKIVADAVKKNIDSLPTDDSPYQEYITAPRTVQKKGLIKGFGIARMQNENGYMHVKLGFDGYNTMKTKKHPGGQPNAMIARSFESGNSFTRKLSFVSKATRATKDAAERKMAETIDKRIAVKMS